MKNLWWLPLFLVLCGFGGEQGGGSSGGGTTITTGSGDFSTCTQTGANLACTVVNSQGNALTSSTFGASLGLSTNTSISATNITTGTLPSAQLPTIGSYYFTGSCGGLTSRAIAANKLMLMGVDLPAPVSFSSLEWRGFTADASRNYDTCVYNSSGTLIADSGTYTMTNSDKNLAVITNAACTGSGTPSVCCTGSGAGTCPTAPVRASGRIFFGFTGATSASGSVSFCNGSGAYSIYFDSTSGEGSTTNGQCPSSITPPTITASGTQAASFPGGLAP